MIRVGSLVLVPFGLGAATRYVVGDVLRVRDEVAVVALLKREEPGNFYPSWSVQRMVERRLVDLSLLDRGVFAALAIETFGTHGQW